MKISVLYFSVIQKITGKRYEQFELPEKINGEQLFLLIAERHPGLSDYKRYLRLAVNQEYQPFETVLKHNDEVVFITPVSGG